ncbi:MAG: FIST N-terminal domain-containing protein [Candidatus Aenigmatarchaeota archaeon]
MKVYSFSENDILEFMNKLSYVKESMNPDLTILFIPASVYENSTFFKLLNLTMENSVYITVSALGVIKNEVLQIKSFAGVSIKFLRNGSFEIMLNKKNEEHKSISEIEEFLQTDKNSTFLIFSTASLMLMVNELISSISKKLDFPINLYGAIASTDLPTADTFLSVGSNIINDGFIILKLNNVDSYSITSLGFLPLGIEYTVTKAYKNLIYELDGKPVREILQKILKHTNVNPEDLDMDLTSKLLWEFPILIKEDDSYIKTVRVIKEYKDGALELYGLVGEGCDIMLSYSNPYRMIKDSQTKLKEMKNLIKYGNKNPELFMTFYCAARYFMFVDNNLNFSEIENLNSFQPTDNIGILSFGEISSSFPGSYLSFLNESLILVGMEEL